MKPHHTLLALLPASCLCVLKLELSCPISTDTPADRPQEPSLVLSSFYYVTVSLDVNCQPPPASTGAELGRSRTAKKEGRNEGRNEKRNEEQQFDLKFFVQKVKEAEKEARIKKSRKPASTSLK